MVRLSLAAALALIAVPTAAAPGKADREALAAARPIGAPVDCVQIRQIRDTRVRSDSVIDFVMNNNRVFRNTLPRSCPRLGFQRAFSYRTSLSQLCSVDIITVIDNVGGGLRPGPSCGLGKFQQVSGVKR
ncbi:hypothetical protein [Sphingomonas jatrophae]|uniref:Uncharacterized protein n=1 Tax=Sphingomonas jatrophae TaxID=1166337 RepID=A0A1I6JH30_9SPHN|nr:hypothetical protein [Sphingomonas jatrophae]SFR78286.1 hypothetical protein SAMN05192580_0266 [Sphingomonas jatrophae]